MPVAFVTSAIAGVMGLGGGMLLIAAMPGLLPAQAIIPVHAFTQLASNASRAAFGWRDIAWSIVPAFALGAIAGAWGGGEIYGQIDLFWLPAIIGVLILLITWVPLPQVPGGGQLALAVLGFYQTGLGMLAGATGPLGASLLLRRNQERDWVVVNTALYMSLNHAIRLAAFAMLGFSFGPWWPLMLAMAAAVIAGSWVGTRMRGLIPQRNFAPLFKTLVSVLALRMIAMPFFS
ncbi:sulfite exporter TauE/SafE family protein [Halioglobus maricola]|uniref:Probable membrane transporter protein n=1 Tax=Halioglobus maricola TaxID=2601894 RepID=A0A5P9NRA6_9GAMM|nr:sulfite exporter TauE/SafE family protein [Halioglobus maricola]